MMLRRIATTCALFGLVVTSQLDGADLSVGNASLQPGTTTSVVVSGNIAGESTFGVTILLEIVPQAGATGTVTFTPAALPVDVDITQLGDPWPGAGTFTPLDTDSSGSTLLNGSVDDNGTFVSAALTFSGTLGSYPVVASVGSDGVWDVLLSTSAGDSAWEGLTTTLLAGTITVFQGECLVDVDCDDLVACTDDTCAAGTCIFTVNNLNCLDDGSFCNGPEICDLTLDCVSSGDPCQPTEFCNETTDVCDECQVAGDCDDLVACTDDTCSAGSCVSTPNDLNCTDDNLFCNGAEVCDPVLSCVSTGTPCQAGESCDEINDVCTACVTPADCDDGDVCTDDACSAGVCVYTNNMAPCDDGLFCTAVDVCGGGTCTGSGDSCPGLVCDEVLDACVAPSASLSVESQTVDAGASVTLTIAGQIAGFSTFGVSIFVELVPRAGNTGSIVFTSAPPTDIVQLGDPWPSLGTFSTFDTDATASPLLNGSIDDNGTFVPGPVTFFGQLAGFPILASADAGGIWDVLLFTSSGASTWEGVTTTLFQGAIIIRPPVSVSINSFAMPPGGTANLQVSGEVQALPTFGVTILVEMAPRIGAIGTLEFTPAPPDDVVQLGDPWPGAGAFTVFDTDLTGSVLLNGSVDDNGSFIPAALGFNGLLSAFPVVASVGADGVWDVTLTTSAGTSGWESLTNVLIDGTITVTPGACILDTECDDSNSCTVDLCNAGFCEYTTVVGACDDGDPCSIGETCSGTVCQGGIPVNCVLSGDQCNNASCDPLGAEGNCSVMTPVLDGTSCVDSDVCNVGETCQTGVCTGGGPVDCVPFDDECNTASCDVLGSEGNCTILTPVLDGTACNGTDVCTVGESCLAGVCVGGGPVDCSLSGDTCNTASCDPVGLVEGNCDTFAPFLDGTPCDDGDRCNINETCLVGVCSGGTPVDCTPNGTQCSPASCDPVGVEGNCAIITILLDGTVCDDTLFCTVTDECSGGVCTGTGDPCTALVLVCDDLIDQCVDCVLDTDCDDANPCTTDTCVTRTCLNTDNTLPCDDGDACTLGDVCAVGACVTGTPVDCSAAGDPCNTASCDTLGLAGNCGILTPVNNGTICDDGVPCTVNDDCQAGVCGGNPKDCSAFDDGCNIGSCDVPTGICFATTTNEGGVCDDGFPCTTGDTCTNGTCSGSLTGQSIVDLGWSPSAQSVQVGQFISVDLIASSGSCVDEFVASIDVVLNWDPTVVVLFQIIDNGPYTWASSGFPDDSGLGGLNSPFTGGTLDNDGDALYQAIADFQNGAPVPPSGLVVTTFEFFTIDGSLGTPITISASAGPFSNTRVLGAGPNFGVDITGVLGQATVQINECQTNADCDDGNICTTDVCSSGVCNFSNNTLPCDDGVFCTDIDTCSGGACLGSGDPCFPPLLCSEPLAACVECLDVSSCIDGNLCTDDVCDATGTCQNPGNTLSCDDGQFCTTVDTCGGGVCVGAGDACPVSVCDEPNDQCVQCLTGGDCNDGNLCTDDLCVSNLCQNPPNTLSCNDGRFCTVTDVCTGGICIGSVDPCILPALCSEAFDACVQCLSDMDCQEQPQDNPCTTDVCTFGACSRSNNTLPCDDGLFCTETDVCSGSVCGGFGDTCPGALCDEPNDICVECFTVADCTPDGIACTVDDCQAGVCTYTPTDSLCDDGGFCTGAEFCNALTGCATPGNPCDDPALCDEITDTCGCSEPVIVAEGSRYFAVTPGFGQTPVALVLTGLDVSVSCVAMYVQADGTLGTTPVFKIPNGPSGWNTVHVHDAQIGPSTTWAVQSECDTGAQIDRSTPASATAWRWADANNSGGLVDILDITLAVDSFRGVFTGGLTIYATDLWGVPPNACRPQEVIDIQDITQFVDAFRGFPYPCAAPCP